MTNSKDSIIELIIYISIISISIILSYLFSNLIKKKDLQKNISIYECGEVVIPKKSCKKKYVNFYGLALIFALLELDIILLWPWSIYTGNNKLNHTFNIAGPIFITLLFIGWAYAYKKLDFLNSIVESKNKNKGNSNKNINNKYTEFNKKYN